MPNHHKYLWLGIGLTIWEVLDHRCHHCTQSQHCDKGDTRFLLRSKKQGPISSIKMTHNNIRNRDLITEHLWVDPKKLSMAWAIVDSFVHLLRLLLYNIQDISFYPRSDQVINGIKEVTHALTHALNLRHTSSSAKFLCPLIDYLTTRGHIPTHNVRIRFSTAEL